MMVLDASAVLTLLQDEAGADEVEDAIDNGAVISAVNLAEVLGKMVDAGATPTRLPGSCWACSPKSRSSACRRHVTRRLSDLQFPTGASRWAIAPVSRWLASVVFPWSRPIRPGDKSGDRLR